MARMFIFSTSVALACNVRGLCAVYYSVAKLLNNSLNNIQMNNSEQSAEMAQNHLLPAAFRYGNLIYYKSSEDKLLPNALDWQDFKWMEENPKSFWETFEPIPLNSKTFSATWYVPKNETCIDCEWAFPFPSYCYVPLQQDSNGIHYYNCSGLYTEVKWFHELQNLYYSITGKELQIKDKSILEVPIVDSEVLSDLSENETLPF